MRELEDRSAELPRYYGKYPGLVIDNAASSGDDGHPGQIKVSVPGILTETPDGQGNQALEVLALPAFPAGFFVVPDPQAPVWVEFVAGDINFPIWSGAFYAKDKAPKTTDGDAPTEKQKVIRTTSGQVILLDDKDGSERTVIKDEKNSNTITLDKDGITIEAGSSASLTLKLGQSQVTVKSDSIEIQQGTTKIKLGADGTTITDPTGSGQGVVLKPVYDWLAQTLLPWLLGHQHVGNMGAPTPLMPVPLAIPPPLGVSHS